MNAKSVGMTPVPERIGRLIEIAYNLWWTWHPEAQELFKRIDAQLWEEVYHNPILFLREVRQSSLDEVAKNPDFIRACRAHRNRGAGYGRGHRLGLRRGVHQRRSRGVASAVRWYDGTAAHGSD